MFSEHFELRELTRGIHAVIDAPGGAAHCNAGIIDLGDRTIVFDTFETPKAARDLKTMAKHITGRSASLVINSHAHFDHWLGNQAFSARTPIVTASRARTQMAELVAYVAGLREDPSELEELLRQSEERLLITDDELELAAVELTITKMKNRIEAIPTWDPRVPDYAFDGHLEIHGTERAAVLYTFGKGHSESDCFLLLPDDSIVFAGDLAHFQQQPFMGSCDAKAWTEQIEFLEAMDVVIIVPGHGPVGTKTEIGLQKRYINEVHALVKQAREHGKSLDEALKLRLPIPFDAWQDQDRSRFATNVRAEYIRRSDAERGGR